MSGQGSPAAQAKGMRTVPAEVAQPLLPLRVLLLVPTPLVMQPVRTPPLLLVLVLPKLLLIQLSLATLLGAKGVLTTALLGGGDLPVVMPIRAAALLWQGTRTVAPGRISRQGGS